MDLLSSVTGLLGTWKSRLPDLEESGYRTPRNLEEPDYRTPRNLGEPGLSRNARQDYELDFGRKVIRSR
ncbi:uncharacterized protein OCT59_018506 [Rhizophagus irregularis]|uniref:Uncharacterized protein n=1 Tax=Rhizophagus irregularis TaxID=588596 RepID=A0A915ZL64_9GLOM|nr:hypothetical protein OCT59_011656 [Rhizophagus irregularis]GET55082.1 hypothetical protein RIR_jg15130.t1 [Rhizophagus irregularis DAOM 181602=DAOM 197198]UZO07618.1 hypothetical protein OCT59_027899 [Rhizophagus irregularis]UZO11701.1 hypothetical protein OCT59_003260 [Rhizophagus irregularis]UZO12052.1 hypothetical protein OCT59_003602 [Rhizophagus irregularis]